MTKVYKCDVDSPIAKTEAGLVRGFFYDGVYNFHGIKYANAKRFMMPEPVEPWEGIKDATNYGFICPVLEAPMPNCEQIIPHRFWPENEDCQFLNVWTNNMDKNAKKAVMVWFHGGGFTSGSSIEQIAYDGNSLAKNDDVVFVTVNHRLNVFGYMDLSAFGEEYKNSVNAGMADLVAALKWVNKNIAEFGGDPENVTILGQSGGGRKVTFMGQIPESAGLYQKAVVMSGVREPVSHVVSGKEIAERLMAELKVSSVKELETVPTAIFIHAVQVVDKQLKAEGKPIQWLPTQNDWYLGDPVIVGFSEQSKKIPTMVGSVLAESGQIITKKNKKELTFEEGEAIALEKLGAENANIVEAFKKAYPEVNPVYTSTVDTGRRHAIVRYCKLKAETATAPVYSYIFDHEFDIESGRLPWHCADIPVFFRNTDLIPLYEADPEMKQLEKNMADTIVAFAKTGDPNNANIPAWAPVTPDACPTMIFDTECIVRTEYDNELVDLLMAYTEKNKANEKKDTVRKWMY